MGWSSEFTLFPQLPTEVRLAIWTLCLPRRVLTIECVPPPRDSKWRRPRDYIWARRPFVPFPPAISRVCSEARQQALWSSRLASYHRSIVFRLQPRRDIVYLKWTWENIKRIIFTRPHDMIDGPHHSGRFCISINLLFPVTKIPPSAPWILRLRDYYAFFLPSLQRFPEHMVIIGEFYIKVPEWAAREAGLFGLLGDEPIQLLDADDMTTMRKMRCLFKKTRHGKCQKSSDTLQFLEAVKDNSSMFLRSIDRMRANFIKLWVCLRWYHHLTKNGITKGLGINEVWLPFDRQRADSIRFPYARSPSPQWWGELESREPNMKNRWVAQIVAKMPVFHPKILIRAYFTKAPTGKVTSISVTRYVARYLS